MPIARPAACALAALGLALLGTSAGDAPTAAGAADRESCGSRGAFVVRRGGSGVVLGRVRKDGGVSYTACSTRYGRKVVLATDRADGAKLAFTLGRARVSGSSATLVYCLSDALGADRHTVKANLRTGRTTRTSVAFETAGCR
ncbi:hypothetical protein [Patulibacter americanus]|uniref:hypothetical protein n=1 Tax=Patulibacter americanus TaxID=588672 RepID=UPI0003B60669|nr:hypothetical protein [Patulibacter americanus]